MKYLVRFLAILSAVFLMTAGSGNTPALAQDEAGVTGFQNVQLWVYPEFDDPRLLVMMEGQIVGAEAPVEVRFLVPSAAEMYSAGSMDAEGQYSGGPPARQASSEPGWDEISYTVTTDTFRVEYYDPVITDQPDKLINYEFRTLYPVSGLTITFQEPKNATRGTIMICDRYIADAAAEIESSLVKASWLQRRLIDLMFALTVKPDVSVLLDVPENVSADRRQSDPESDYLTRLHRIYQELAERRGMVKKDNRTGFEDVADSIVRMVAPRYYEVYPTPLNGLFLSNPGQINRR